MPFAISLLGGIIGAIFDHFLVGAMVGVAFGGGAALLVHLGIAPNSRFRSSRPDPFEQMAPEDKAKALVAYAINRSNARDVAAAKKSLADAIAACPEFVDAWRTRAMLLLNTGDGAGAVQDASKAIELEPNRGQAYCIRALARKDQNDSESAMTDFDKAIELDPGNSLNYLHRADASRQLGRMEDAAQDYRKALDLDPASELVGVAKERLDAVLEQIGSRGQEDKERDERLQEIQSLTEELIRIGHKSPRDSDSSSHFLSSVKPRARQIGARLHEIGGLKLMLNVHARIGSSLGRTSARELEAAWGGVGEWQS
jgi:tetratricopeptide (TPR) repeat protein